MKASHYPLETGPHNRLVLPQDKRGWRRNAIHRNFKRSITIAARGFTEFAVALALMKRSVDAVVNELGAFTPRPAS